MQIDHEILEDIDAVGDHVFYAPICLFYLQHLCVQPCRCCLAAC